MYYQNNRRTGGWRGRRDPKPIDSNLFVRKAQDEAVEQYVCKNSFADFPLSDQLRRNVESRGYQQPTPIQDQAIPELFLGRDVVGIAQTGTGKTAAFLLPLIEKVNKARGEKVLIVVPTRELAVQIAGEFNDFVKTMGIQAVVCIGGVPIRRQMNDLRRNFNFVIGTPGRLKDLENHRAIGFGVFNSIVLDEVDRMLDMGFVNDIKQIVAKLPKVRQSLFFSATLPDDTRKLANEFLVNPVTISVRAGKTAASVEQDVVRVNGRQKVDVLHELLIKEEFEKVLIFGRTKLGIEKLSRTLTQRGFQVVSIHGNKTQSQRQLALEQFRQDRIRILLATDIASRGLDINDVTHVINYDAPTSYEDYIHRIGRTGRADKKGKALTFVD